MDYVEYRPSPPLALYVRCYWNLRCGARAHSIFPDGRLELVFHFGGTIRDAFTLAPRPRVIIAGQIACPLSIEVLGHTDVFGVRLQPAAARALLGVRAPELTGSIVDAPFTRLAEILGNEPDPANRARIADRWFSRRVVSALDPVAAHCASELARGSSLRGLRLADRQFRRRFVEAVGIGPKLFARIARFQRSLALVQRLPLAHAAVDAGFSDQAHLTRDFRQFAGLTPSQWLDQNVRFLQDTSRGD